MENRKFTIEFYEIEWFIDLQSHIDNGDSQLDIIQPITKTRDKRIARIFDIFAPETEYIDKAKEYKEFYEICDFEVPQTNHKFTGTFIDALEYIKDTFNQVSKTV
ncbi:hypothetical protein A0Y14_08020 [Campylobacter fetus]|uniref:hypothetical protein n=2 Tax=Campylobacter fetus TaxID=196 RepID=UPI0003C27D84|nr:hypothetical protein [Campylobacter fetus]AGZ81521.1 hypothetical protein CFT03427_0653 [Campylobacter fetus subsp. testudinum 03-427]EAI4391989.1 hypothetical protein [Campylobacter fetus]UEA64786.1 hypothetical protein LK457_06950 [Campylobacter fetus subsp. testudinum]